MNKQEAYIVMQQGYRVCNEFYSDEEFAFINEGGLIEYEDGCIVGDQFSENWVKYQDPENKLEWSVWVNKNFTLPKYEPLIIHALPRDYIPAFYPTKDFTPKNHKRTNKK